MDLRGCTSCLWLYLLKADIDHDVIDSTSGVLANGTFPGPALKFNKGDRAKVSKANFANLLMCILIRLGWA
jgi:hypothetical protein